MALSLTWEIVIIVFSVLAVGTAIFLSIFLTQHNSGTAVVTSSGTVTPTTTPPNRNRQNLLLQDNNGECFVLNGFSLQLNGPQVCSATTGQWTSSETPSELAFSEPKVFSACVNVPLETGQTVTGGNSSCAGVSLETDGSVQSQVVGGATVCIQSDLTWGDCGTKYLFTVVPLS